MWGATKMRDEEDALAHAHRGRCATPIVAHFLKTGRERGVAFGDEREQGPLGDLIYFHQLLAH